MSHKFDINANGTFDKKTFEYKKLITPLKFKMLLQEVDVSGCQSISQMLSVDVSGCRRIMVDVIV